MRSNHPFTIGANAVMILRISAFANTSNEVQIIPVKITKFNPQETIIYTEILSNQNKVAFDGLTQLRLENDQFAWAQLYHNEKDYRSDVNVDIIRNEIKNRMDRNQISRQSYERIADILNIDLS